ncbi:helix-turn-helix domain-containing protein [Albimonas sp. CAU 1670]|uniref:helix-turn-helix domain-containing protein n=1 Tax=Albimonas sp. CAU 1670 TaxID=3032599 RepID=UPI0023D97B73|nr:helix-turn-helix domain-containing protein [Albimonas sp. CAU 1670]MDF2235766.1 helix-turn-helix domain-containing protein [Albimonas sp. CAU 1670]
MRISDNSASLGGGGLAVSPADAARLAGVGRTKIYEAIGSGELPSIKFGKRRLVRVAAIEAWLAAMEARTGAV